MPTKVGIHDLPSSQQKKSWIPAGACPCEGRGRHDRLGIGEESIIRTVGISHPCQRLVLCCIGLSLGFLHWTQSL